MKDSLGFSQFLFAYRSERAVENKIAWHGCIVNCFSNSVTKLSRVSPKTGCIRAPEEIVFSKDHVDNTYIRTNFVIMHAFKTSKTSLSYGHWTPPCYACYACPFAFARDAMESNDNPCISLCYFGDESADC